MVWSTKPANITIDDYRAEVWIAGRKMGFADIRVVANAKDLKNVPAGFAGVLKSKSLTLAFRLELEIVASIDVTPRNPAIDSGDYGAALGHGPSTSTISVIPNAVVTWASAPASVAAVSSAGLVTGVSPGIAVVTASSGGAFAADTITVKRPIADWSGAVEWTTYQGNASHTGYNPVAMDVRVFQELWSKTVSTAALNPVTAGDGKVFVSTNAYFGIQQAKSLDARTGTELWSRNFGSIHSVNPPAYANGTVYLQTGGHGDSFLWALDAANGSVRFQSAYLNQWSRYFAPVIVGSSVYVAGGYYGGMYAFNATDGTQRWFAALEPVRPVHAGGEGRARVRLHRQLPAEAHGRGRDNRRDRVRDRRPGLRVGRLVDEHRTHVRRRVERARDERWAAHLVQPASAQHRLRDHVQLPRAGDGRQRRGVRRERLAGRGAERERRLAPVVVDAAGGTAGRDR